MRRIMRFSTRRVGLIVPFAAFLCGTSATWASTILGTAANFGVLGCG